MSIELAKAYVQIVPSADGLGNSITEAFGAAGDTAGTEGGKRAGSKFASALGAAAKGAGAVLAAAGTAVGAVVKEAVQGFAEYEQLVGGVETLFKDRAGTVQEYAANAYKTAGLSANEYMETVTSFSASLLQSLDGDTAAATEAANLAITDMSDNANKMGSDMASIQNAYQGFAKQNYTMLDNLKLGYGGTKEEMERLLKDATALSGVEYDLSSYADIVEAIHVIQTEMGITGTTAAEASTTISGSFGSLKAAWSNLLVGMADGSQDLGGLIDNLVDSAMTFGDNLVPVVTQALEGVGAVVAGLAPVIVAELPGLAESLLPGLLDAAMSIIDSLVAAFPGLVTTIVTSLVGYIPEIVNAGLVLFTGLIGALPEIINTIVAALPQIIDGIVGAVMGNLSPIIDAGVDLFVALVENLPAIIAGIVQAVPSIVTGLLTAITSSFPRMISAGYNLMLGLRQGIWNAVSAVWQALKGAINSVISWAMNLLGIASPSKVFAEIGGYTMAGFAEGILDNTGLVKDAMSDASALATGAFTSTLDYNVRTSAAAQPAANADAVARAVAAQLRGLRVYIDGDKMIGYITPGMDSALGGRQVLAGRGVI